MIKDSINGNLSKNLEVSLDDAGMRLDRWLKRQIPGLTQGLIEKFLRKGYLRVNQSKAKASQRLEPGQIIQIPSFQNFKLKQFKVHHVSIQETKELQATILYKDNEMIVINKPPGLAVQGGSKTHKHLDLMLDALKFDFPSRPKLVHRLDKQTSGVIILARSRSSADFITKAFQQRTVKKIYWALVNGTPPEEKGVVDLSIQKISSTSGFEKMQSTHSGSSAVTNYRVLNRIGRKITWLALEPETGRTHQLRAHMEAIGNPIIGDTKYHKSKWPSIGGLPEGLYLHAREISILNINTGKLVSVVAPLPKHMRDAWERLGFKIDNED